jgi:hypothetical protein
LLYYAVCIDAVQPQQGKTHAQKVLEDLQQESWHPAMPWTHEEIIAACEAKYAIRAQGIKDDAVEYAAIRKAIGMEIEE